MDKESIFAEALKQDSPAERSEFLAKACAGDAALRSEIEELLAAHRDAGSFLAGTPEGIGESGKAERSGLSKEAWRELLSPSDRQASLGKLGPYEIIELTGRGGMGVVLRAHDPKLNRVVAIKVLAPELAENAIAVRRFLREARAAAAVSHDHVVTIHAIDEDMQPPFIVMEYVDGQSLQKKIDASGPLDVKSVLRISRQIAAGLAAAHRQGLVHRDIKPANILLENGVERVKLTDFGLARAVDDIAVTQTGHITGTPQYMSPEQAQGQSVDHRTDLFSLGCVLYAMCTGRAAFQADSAVAVMHRVVHDDPRPIHLLNEGIPNWLSQIAARLLCKNPSERFQTADEVEDLLGRHLAHLQQPEVNAMPQPVVLPTRATDWSANSIQDGRFAAHRALFRTVVKVVVAVLAFMLLSAVTAAVIYYSTGSSLQPRRDMDATRKLFDEETPFVDGDNTLPRLEPGSPRVKDSEPPRASELVVTLERNWGTPMPREPVTCLDVSPDGRWLASGHGVGGSYGVSLWDVHSNGAERISIRAAAEVRDIVFSPDGAQFAWVQADGKLRVAPADLTADTSVESLVSAKEPLTCLTWPLDGLRMIAGGPTRLHVWDTRHGGEPFDVMLKSDDKRGVPPAFVELVYMPDGNQFATGHADGRIIIWRDADGPFLLRELRDTSREPYRRAHRGAVSGLAFSPGGSRLYSCGQDGLVHEWNVVSGTPTSTNLSASREPIGALALSPDATRWAVARFRPTTGSISLLNRDARDEIRFPLKGSHAEHVTGMAFTRDGKHLISGGGDGLIKWWKFSEPLARGAPASEPLGKE